MRRVGREVFIPTFVWGARGDFMAFAYVVERWTQIQKQRGQSHY